MDVLQVIKTEHEDLRALLKQLSDLDSVVEKRKVFERLNTELDRHMVLEEHYLYPEISELFQGADSFVDVSLARHKILRKHIKQLSECLTQPVAKQKNLNELIEKFNSEASSHLTHEEDAIMPKLRRLIPTQDREDLGVVFLDARDHALEGLKKTLNGKEAVKGKKRA